MSAPFWKDLKVIVCAGTGGVGKTTVSAALGAWLASEGKRTLVLTIDPARRLAQALGLGPHLDAEVVIDHPALKNNLSATMLDAHSVFDRFVKRVSPSPEIAQKLIQNRLYQQLVTNLTGSQEFTSLERMLSVLESGKYDVLILDTPPSQNAVDFLRAPERIYALFQESVTKWFVQRSESRGLLGKIWHHGTRTVISALERVTGAAFIRELSDFFEQMSHLQAQVRERSLEVQKLLKSPSTGFVLVTGFDEVKLKEAQEFQKDLVDEGYFLSAMIINRCFPEWTGWEGPAASGSDPEMTALKDYYQLLKAQFDHRLQLANQIQAGQSQSIPLLKIPEFKTSPQGLEDLIKLSAKIKERWEKL